MNADRLVSGLEFLAATPLLWLSLTLLWRVNCTTDS